MIIKSFEIHKIRFNLNNIILLYGKNEGLKKEAIKNLFKNLDKVYTYDEKDILENINNFFEIIKSKSLFEEEKFILIKRASDKISKIIQEIEEIDLQDVKIIIEADNLEKKSKLRVLFEKSKKYVSVAFYPDNNQNLSRVALNFLKKENISISNESINLIIDKANGDRAILLNELDKIKCFSLNGKKIDNYVISKLTNIIENHSISELVDNCLAKNKKKIINMLNENNFKNEECILITRTFLYKLKKLLKLSKEYEKNKNVELTISSAKPPIFWKDKEVTKQQILKWKSKNINETIFKLNEIETQIKKNLDISINIITDFILNQTSSNPNN